MNEILLKILSNLDQIEKKIDNQINENLQNKFNHYPQTKIKYDRFNMDGGYKKSLQRKLYAPGLENFNMINSLGGSRCFINSVLQIFYCMTKFTNFLILNRSHYTEKDSIAHAFIDILIQMVKFSTNDPTTSKQLTNNKYLDKFYNLLPGKFNPVNSISKHSNSQNDAEELFTFIFNRIIEEPCKNKSLCKQIVFSNGKTHYILSENDYRLNITFKIKKYIKNYVIRKISKKIERNLFFDINMYKKPTNIQNYIDTFINQHDQVIENNELTHKIKNKIIDIGDYFLIKLNIYGFNQNGFKIMNKILIDNTLTINNYKLKLKAVLCHLGMSLGSGHYITFVRISSNVFLRYDDKNVLPIKIYNNLEFYRGSQTPFILCYKKS